MRHMLLVQFGSERPLPIDTKCKRVVSITTKQRCLSSAGSCGVEGS